MDKWGIAQGLIGVTTTEGNQGQQALERYPDRFIPSASADPNRGMDAVRDIAQLHDRYGIRAVGLFPAGTNPQVAINDKLMYPIYAKCVELGIAVFCCAGIPGPRLRFAPQQRRADRRGLLRLPRAGVRDTARL